MSINLNQRYWGYLHSNGTIQCKRWFVDVKDYTEDCENNPFVAKVVPPFWAADREAAIVHLENLLLTKPSNPLV